jgi:hypothetical protein
VFAITLLRSYRWRHSITNVKPETCAVANVTTRPNLKPDTQEPDSFFTVLQTTPRNDNFYSSSHFLLQSEHKPSHREYRRRRWRHASDVSQTSSLTFGRDSTRSESGAFFRLLFKLGLVGIDRSTNSLFGKL